MIKLTFFGKRKLQRSHSPSQKKRAILKAITLEEQLLQHGVCVDSNEEGYHPMLAIVNTILGYKPKINALSNVWKPGFRSFHLIFKGSTNMPTCLMGSDPMIKDIFAAMFVSSLKNSCEYCTCHTMSVALRRGIDPSFFSDPDGLDGKYRALHDYAQAITSVPSELTSNHIRDLKQYYDEGNVEWITLSVSMMGFLNLLSSSFGLKLEQLPLDDSAAILGSAGWTPGQHTPDEYEMPDPSLSSEIEKDGVISTMLRMSAHAPQAMFIETSWIIGIPSAWPSVGKYLHRRVGYNFPILARLGKINRAPMKSYTAIFRDHFDPKQSTVDPVIKSLAALVFAHAMGSKELSSFCVEMATSFATQGGDGKGVFLVDDELIHRIEMLADSPLPKTPQDCKSLLRELSSYTGVKSTKNAAILILARATSTRPTVVPPLIVTEVASMLSAEVKAETVIWVGLQQCFLRTLSYVGAREEMDSNLSA